LQNLSPCLCLSSVFVYSLWLGLGLLPLFLPRGFIHYFFIDQMTDIRGSPWAYGPGPVTAGWITLAKVLSTIAKLCLGWQPRHPHAPTHSHTNITHNSSGLEGHYGHTQHVGFGGLVTKQDSIILNISAGDLQQVLLARAFASVADAPGRASNRPSNKAL